MGPRRADPLPENTGTGELRGALARRRGGGGGRRKPPTSFSPLSSTSSEAGVPEASGGFQGGGRGREGAKVSAVRARKRALATLEIATSAHRIQRFASGRRACGAAMTESKRAPRAEARWWPCWATRRGQGEAVTRRNITWPSSLESTPSQPSDDTESRASSSSPERRRSIGGLESEGQRRRRRNSPIRKGRNVSSA